jgi:hypothetical protein
MSVEFRNIQNTNSDKCAICLDEDVQNGFVSHKIDEKVQHVFHEECLTPWLENNPSCPLCRLNVSSINGQAVANPVLGKDVIRAATQGNYERVRELLTQGVISEMDRGSALIEAAECGSIDIVHALMENGPIDVGLLETAFLRAAKNDVIEIVKLLLEKGSISTFERGRAILDAARRSSSKIVSLILEKGPILDVHCTHAIQAAVNVRCINTAHELLEKGGLSGESLIEMNRLLKRHAIISSVVAFALPALGAAICVLIKSGQEALGII